MIFFAFRESTSLKRLTSAAFMEILPSRVDSSPGKKPFLVSIVLKLRLLIMAWSKNIFSKSQDFRSGLSIFFNGVFKKSREVSAELFRFIFILA